MGALLPTTVDYTDLDFAALRPRLFNLISSVFPKWTATDVANFGNIMVEMFAFVGDVLAYYENQQGRESRWSTATQRGNMLALVKLIGFKAYGATAAQSTEVFSIAAPTTGDLPIPAGTICTTQTAGVPLRFRLLVALVIPAGQLTISGTVENSDAQQDVFSGTGLPNQAVVLSANPYLDGSAVVACGNGAYTEVDNFLSSLPTDRNYTIVTDSNGVATLTFGNGTNGAIPVGSINVVYATGGGAVVVDDGTITTLQGTFIDTLGNVVPVTCTNPGVAQGGLAQQSVAQIRAKAPQQLQVLTRTVGRTDYEINAERVAGVARALMLTSNEDPAVQENNGNLYVIPYGGGAAGTALKAAVLTMVTVTYPNTITFNTAVWSASYVAVNITVVVYLKPGALAAAVNAAINAALTAFFQVEGPNDPPNLNVDFGFNYKNAAGGAEPLVNWGTLFDLVSTTAGVRRLLPTGFQLNNQCSDLPLTPRQFPQLGSVTLINGDTNEPL